MVEIACGRLRMIDTINVVRVRHTHSKGYAA